MRFVKLAAISVVFFFLLATFLSLLIPSRVRISKAINFARKNNVLSLVKDQTKWPLWYPAYNDSVAANTWKKIEKKEIANTDSSYTLQLRQEGRKPVTSGWIVHRYANPDSVTLQWYMDFRLSWYPWQKLSSLFYEKNYGVMMEKGLANLKKLSEQPFIEK